MKSLYILILHILLLWRALANTGSISRQRGGKKRSLLWWKNWRVSDWRGSQENATGTSQWPMGLTTLPFTQCTAVEEGSLGKWQLTILTFVWKCKLLHSNKCSRFWKWSISFSLFVTEWMKTQEKIIRDWLRRYKIWKTFNMGSITLQEETTASFLMVCPLPLLRKHRY